MTTEENRRKKEKKEKKKMDGHRAGGRMGDTSDKHVDSRTGRQTNNQ